LETSNDIFWVQGKAGSGKSTFMKFLFEHEQTQVHLQRWAGGDVIAAAFFFWNAGSSELEKSHLGLLRGLLYQILQECPELIELVFPQRWIAVTRSATCKKPWSKVELVTAFDLLLQSSETNSRFCFFIDGLDEFDGDHRDLIDAIRSLSKSPFIKVCVSSRPWTLFQKELGIHEDLHVALQTLTERDIDVYITSKLETTASEIYRAGDMRRLGDTVRSRSHGVFLWVSLAVRDLRRGIDGHDSMRMLQERLEAYPLELEDFIQQIFQGIDTAYKRFTGRLLLLMLERMPTALINLGFLEDAFTTNGEYVVNTHWVPRGESEIYRLIDRAATCANNWCKDLLQPVDATEVKNEIIMASTGRVRESARYTDTLYVMFCSMRLHLSFAHRSIHHFAEAKAKDGTLSTMAGCSFGSRLAWLYALVEFSRYAPNLQGFVGVVSYASWIPATLFITAEKDKKLADGIQQCLQALDLIGQNIGKQITGDHWTTDRLVEAGHRMPTGGGHSSFVSYLVCQFFPGHVISSFLTQNYETLTWLQRQFVLETCLVPRFYIDAPANIEGLGDDYEHSCMLGHPTKFCDIIIQVIRSGIDVNRPTQRIDCSQNYSVWQFYLLWLHD
jgi:hypothetical protein